VRTGSRREPPHWRPEHSTAPPSPEQVRRALEVPESHRRHVGQCGLPDYSCSITSKHLRIKARIESNTWSSLHTTNYDRVEAIERFPGIFIDSENEGDDTDFDDSGDDTDATDEDVISDGEADGETGGLPAAIQKQRVRGKRGSDYAAVRRADRMISRNAIFASCATTGTNPRLAVEAGLDGVLRLPPRLTPSQIEMVIKHTSRWAGRVPPKERQTIAPEYRRLVEDERRQPLWAKVEREGIWKSAMRQGAMGGGNGEGRGTELCETAGRQHGVSGASITRINLRQPAHRAE
jgi:hypothetical protein